MKVVEVDEFFVVGIATRTSNEREMAGEGIIGKQWERFMKEDILGQIPNKSDGRVIGLYTDYSGDQNGEYTILAGAPVTSLDQIPAGMTGKRVSAGRYAVVTSERAPMVQAVVGAWQKVWMTSPSELGGERAFGTDFEVYDERARDRENAQVDLYIGLK